MALINRIARIFKADFHAVLDRIEEPAELLRQAVRDMADELARSERQIAVHAREQESLLQRRSALTRKLADLEQELDLCFASHKEELARSLVRRKLESQRLLAHVDTRHAAGERQFGEQRTRHAQNHAALEAMKQKAEIFAERAPRHAQSASADDSWGARALAIGDDEIDIAFLREQQTRSAS